MSFYIVSVRVDGLYIIGPFATSRDATEQGKTYSDSRWNVIDLGEPCDYGMANNEPFDNPHFVVPVTRPEEA